MPTLTGTSNAERYLQGLASFVRDEKDNPDCVAFYRAWKGIQAVLGNETVSAWHHFLHECVITGSYKADGEQYATIVRYMRYVGERFAPKEEPRYSHSWECSPSQPTEEEVRAFFNAEYKRAFPGKRAGSKEANVLYAEKREQALSILREQYSVKLAVYEAREAERDARNAKLKSEWIEQSWNMALWEELIRGLESQV